MQSTRVQFVRYPDHDVIAVFPDAPGRASDLDGTRLCYAHAGQHHAATLDYIRDARPATPSEYADLHRELTAIYGRLEVLS